MSAVKSTHHERRLHPLPVRVMHWINAVAIFIMIGSGWKIYNDEVLFGWLHFPDWITLGGEAQGALWAARQHVDEGLRHQEWSPLRDGLIRKLT